MILVRISKSVSPWRQFPRTTLKHHTYRRFLTFYHSLVTYTPPNLHSLLASHTPLPCHPHLSSFHLTFCLTLSSRTYPAHVHLHTSLFRTTITPLHLNPFKLSKNTFFPCNNLYTPAHSWSTLLAYSSAPSSNHPYNPCFWLFLNYFLTYLKLSFTAPFCNYPFGAFLCPILLTFPCMQQLSHCHD